MSSISEMDANLDRAMASIIAHVKSAEAGNIRRPDKVYYVDSVAGGDGNDGRTEATALKTIRAALAKAYSGDTVKILLKHGGTYPVGGVYGSNRINGRYVLIASYGDQTQPKPIVRGYMDTYTPAGGTTSAAVNNAFAASMYAFINFHFCDIRTGVLPTGVPVYSPDFGGMISREGGEGESSRFSASFNQCDITYEDANLITGYYGSVEVTFNRCNIKKAGSATAILADLLPRVLDIRGNTISGFGSTDLKTLFKLVDGSYIMRQSGNTITA